MSTDAYFTIGTSHLVCQDYALAREGRLPHAIVSDGCSSSPSSDFGARLLSLAATHLLAGAALPFAPAFALERAAEMAASLGLERSCLDATLLCAWRDGDTTRISLTGDGVVAARRRDGRLESWTLSYDDSAPAYLSYLLSPERLAHYLGEHGNRRLRHHLGGVLVEDRSEHLSRSPYCFELELPAEDYPLVTLFSDGVTSFVERSGQGRTRVELERVLGPLMAFKSHCGRFLTRRCRRFLRKTCPRLGWSHEDDLAAAALNLVGEQSLGKRSRGEA